MKTLVLACCLLIAGLPAAAATGRSVAIIVDTSGSMRSNDKPRYTVQITKIVTDLLANGDDLTVIGMPGSEFTCSAGASSSLAISFDPSDRAGFKQRFDSWLQYGTGTFFAAPIHTAIRALSRHPEGPRLLLIVADSGGLGGCEAELTQELESLHSDGVQVAAVNLGSTAGAFDGNPAFDFTTAALDSHALIEAVGRIYQSFLGARTVQTGSVRGPIEVEVAPHVRAAFLIVAADGPVRELVSDPGNPGARALELDYHGGGETQGLDGQLRGYRIARLERPAAGRWVFRVPDLRSDGGWLLVQDLSSLGLRLVSSPQVAKGVATPLVAELYDAETGEAIRDPTVFRDLGATLEVDGRTVQLRPDGQGHLTGQVTFASAGRKTLSGRLRSDLLDQAAKLDLEVLDSAWDLQVRTPPRGEAGKAVTLAAELVPIGNATSLKPPERIDALTDEATIPLHDRGEEGDERAGDRIYSARWTPAATGTHAVTYRAVGGSRTPEAAAPFEASGHLDLGSAVPLRLGPVSSRSQVEGRLDLSSATVRGRFDLAVTSDFSLRRSALEIDPGSGWVALGDTPVALVLEEGGRSTWPVRLRVGDCPAACSADHPWRLQVTAQGPDGKPLQQEFPLQVTVAADAWLHCWWPVLALVGSLTSVAVVIYGFWSPSRFPPRLGVMLSPEEDISEGFFHPIRAQRGSGSGFYRDARIYVRTDFRLSARPAGALARLRAQGNRTRILSMPGGELLRQNADDEWEPLPAGEVSVRFGQLFRNGAGTLFFEIRNG